MLSATVVTRRAPLVALLACFTIVAAALVAVAPAARAAITINLTVSNGTVGVVQTVKASLSSGMIGTPAGQMSFFVGGAEIASAPIGGSDGSSVTANWLPGKSGSNTMQARFTPVDGTAPSTTSRTVQIAKISTKTTLSVPATVDGNGRVSLSASVKVSRGEYVPTGSVTFKLSTGATVGKANLDGGGNASTDVSLPGSSSRVGIVAAYSGDAGAMSSNSSTGYVKVSPSATTVKLSVPETVPLGSPVTIVATISPASARGKVLFKINGVAMNSVMVVNASASMTWTAKKAGAYTVVAEYSGSGNVKPGRASEKFKVIKLAKPDQITVAPEGSPTPWVPGSTATLTNGADVKLTAVATSGAPVTLSVAGPCTLAENVLHVNGVGGTCQLTATSPGGNGFTAATTAYSVATAAGAQTAAVDPPADGAYAKDTTLKLAPVPVVTNVGQPIIWYVEKGPKVCKVIRKGGWFKALLKKKGTCTVVGVSPPISDQWSEFRITRVYTVVKAA